MPTLRTHAELHLRLKQSLVKLKCGLLAFGCLHTQLLELRAHLLSSELKRVAASCRRVSILSAAAAVVWLTELRLAARKSSPGHCGVGSRILYSRHRIAL